MCIPNIICIYYVHVLCYKINKNGRYNIPMYNSIILLWALVLPLAKKKLARKKSEL